MSDTEVEDTAQGTVGGHINVQNKNLLNLLDDQGSDKSDEAPVTTVYAESPVFSKEDERKYKFVSEDVDEFDEEQNEALRQSKENEEAALKEKLENVQVDVTGKDDVTNSKPDAVVNLTFDSEGNLIGAEQEERVQSGKSSGSTQFAVKRKGSGAKRDSSASRKGSANSTASDRNYSAKFRDRQNSAKSKERENSAKNRSSAKAQDKKKGGMKPLSREEQQDMEELQREEEYQRAEQKKIQELQNKAQGINIPRLDLVDSEDENKGDASDLAFHEGVNQDEKSTSETMDSLDDSKQDREEWTDPPQNPFPYQQAQSDLDTPNQRNTPPKSEPPPQHSAHSTESYRLHSEDNLPSQPRDQVSVTPSEEDPRLQQLFSQHYAQEPVEYPRDPRRAVRSNDPSGHAQFHPNQDQAPPQQQYQPYQNPNQQVQYGGHYYVEANIAPPQNQHGGYRIDAPVQVSPRVMGYQGNPQVDMVPAQNGYYHHNTFVPPQNHPHLQYHDQNYPVERGYNPEYDNEPESVTYEQPQSYSASSYQSSLPSKPEGPDFVSLNKKNLKNPQKKSYRAMHGKKKETENEPPFVPQGRKPRPPVNSPKKGNSPLKALPNQQPANQVNPNQEPMTAEEFWAQRAANLEQRKAEKMAGGRNGRRVTMKKYPSESRVDQIKPQRVVPIQQQPHAMAEPIKSEIIRSPRGQPITQAVYTEDGQRVSVDINLKLISPPPAGGPTKAFNFNSDHQRAYQHPPLQLQQQQSYYPEYQMAHQIAQHPGHNAAHVYSYGQQAVPQNTYGYGQANQFTYKAPSHQPQSGRTAWAQNDPQGYGSAHYDQDPRYAQSPIQSPYRVLPPIGSAEARERRMEEMYYQELMAQERSGQHDTSPRKDHHGPSPRRDVSPRRGGAEEDPGSYMDQFKKSKNKKVEYKEYTLKDYRKMKKEVRLGGLGPDVDSEDVREKKEKINRQQEYARQIKEKNRQALENSKRKLPPPRPQEDPEKESLLDRRKMVLEYARSVPRPKAGTSGASSKSGSVQSAPASATTGGAGYNEEEMMALERLAERHAREKEQTEAIRQNISAR